jgi:hypothetical protein
MQRYSISQWVNVAWDAEGKFLTLNFRADDQMALALAMPPDLLEALRQDIAYALAHRP